MCDHELSDDMKDLLTQYHGYALIRGIWGYHKTDPHESQVMVNDETGLYRITIERVRGYEKGDLPGLDAKMENEGE